MAKSDYTPADHAYVDLVDTFCREHNASDRWSGFDHTEYRAMQLFAQWLDKKEPNEIERLRNITAGCPICAELAANIKTEGRVMERSDIVPPNQKDPHGVDPSTAASRTSRVVPSAEGIGTLISNQIRQRGQADGLDFNVMSDTLVIVRAPESSDAAVYLMGVIDGLRCEIARLRSADETTVKACNCEAESALDCSLSTHDNVCSCGCHPENDLTK